MQNRSGALVSRVIVIFAVLLLVGYVGYQIGTQSAPVTPTEMPTAAAAVATATSQVPSVDTLEGTRWRLSGWSVAERDPAEETIDLEFIDGRISGSSAVNVYNADYQAAADGSFRVGTVAMTKMAGPEAAMQLESLYIALLEASAGFQLDGATLTLLDADGNASLVFTQQ